MTNGFDKLLRDSLSADTAAGDGSECLDAALVAGWFDGTLSQAERAAVEAHAASCSRCQAMIAALVRTDRPSPRLWWRAPAVRWLVPAAVAAAASLVFWITALRPDRALPEMSSAARVESSVPPAREIARSLERPDSGATAAAADAMVPARPSAVAQTRATDADSRPVSEQTQERPGKVPAFSPPHIEPLREPVGAAAPLPQSPEPTTSKASPAPPAARAAASGPPAALPSGQANTNPSADAAGELRARGFAESVLLRAGRGGRAAVIQSPDRSVHWRIAGAGQINRSIDGGITWQTQTTGVSAVLTAGAAASANVCWLVGRQGVVLKTADGGQTWRRVAFPEEVNLLGVVADDDRVASVTVAGGRRFHTTDGGETWR